MKPGLLLRAVACLAVGAGSVRTSGADDPTVDKAARAESKLLQGEWKIVAAEANGEATASHSLVRFEGMKCTITDPGSGVPSLECMITLDPTRQPKWMDVTNVKLKTTDLGIYELKGDTLKAVFQSNAKGRRPAAFKTMKGSGEVMYTYERVKPK